MKAVTFDICPVGWVTCRWLRYLWRGCLLSRLNGLRLQDLPAPELPGEDWVLLRTLLGGICGTDVALAAQKQAPNSFLEAFSSRPMVLGHENVSVVERVGPAVDRAWLGRRVCVEPTLGCTARGIEPPCPRCQAGQFGACENFADATLGRYGLPPGTSIGYNNRTGGSLGEMFVAHVSQLVPVPADLSDELAVLTDPLACGLHAVLRADLNDARQVLVYGAGALGLSVTAALRAVGFAGRIDVLGRAEYRRPLATALGAEEYLLAPASAADRFALIARRTGSTVQRGRFGNYMLSGGYDVVFECVGSSRSVEEALKWTRARGQAVMIGTATGRGTDLTAVWFRELCVLGAYGRQVESFAGRRVGTYPLVHELMTSGKLPVQSLLTHTFPIGRWRQAFEVSMDKGRHRAIKVAIDFR